MPLDIGNGLILGVWLSSLTGYNYGLSLLIGVFACLAPDMDYVWKVVQTKRLPHSEHRDGLHYPILVIPLIGALGLLINPYLALILLLGSLAHFIHDSIGVGFGVKWLFPFNKNSFLFLFQIKTPANKDMPKKRFYSWNDDQRNEMIKKYAYDDWIRYVYFKLNWFGIFEYIVLVIGLIISFRSY